MSSSMEYLWRGLFSEPPSLPSCTYALSRKDSSGNGHHSCSQVLSLITKMQLEDGRVPSNVTREEDCGVWVSTCRCQAPCCSAKGAPRGREKAHHPVLCCADLGGASPHSDWQAPHLQGRGPCGGHAWLSQAPGHPDVRRSPPAQFTALSHQVLGPNKVSRGAPPWGRESVYTGGRLPSGDGAQQACLAAKKDLVQSVFFYTFLSARENLNIFHVHFAF